MRTFGFRTIGLAAPIVIVITFGCGSVAAVSPTAPDYSATPVFGGGGGGDFLAYCPRDTFLVGISGRHGDWIDAIQPICAKWNDATQAFGAPVRGPVTGGSGGGDATLMCPAGMAVKGWEIAQVANTTPRVVRYVRPQCEAVLPDQRPSASIPGQFGSQGTAAPADRMAYTCRAQQMANGIYGRSGAYVDSAGLKCFVQPVILGKPTPAPVAPTVTSIGKRAVAAAPAGPARSICEAARDARARQSPAAPNLEAQCRRAGESAPPPAAVEGDKPPLAIGSDPAAAPTTAPARAKGVTYNSPMIVAANGQTVMLDYCREYGSACGKPAADAFCRMKGHPDAVRFQISEDIGFTAIISSGAICNDPSCDGFTKIQCRPDPE